MLIDTSERDITQHPDGVVGVDGGVPSVDQRSVHHGDIGVRPARIVDDVGVAEVEISGEAAKSWCRGPCPTAELGEDLPVSPRLRRQQRRPPSESHWNVETPLGIVLPIRAAGEASRSTVENADLGAMVNYG